MGFSPAAGLGKTSAIDPNPSDEMTDCQDQKVDVIHEENVGPSRARVLGNNAPFTRAMRNEPPNPRSRDSLALFAACLVGFFCATMNGYDGSLYNSIAANETFLEYFRGSNKGIWAGIVSSIYQIGGIAALPFVGPINDSLGRRVGMFSGAVFVIVGTVISATVTGGSVKQFMGGRFLLGFGVAITSAAGPMYVTEVSHPAYRGRITAFFNTFWFTGSILASGVSRGSAHLSDQASWRIPLWVQLLFAGLIFVFVFFLPESPRWLYVHNKKDKAKAVLAKYHGQGNPESEWVRLQLAEYDEYLIMDGADKRWWDYRALFSSRASKYRMFCSCCIAVFGQWAGNAVLSYFMSAVLDAAGVTGTVPHLNVILINSCHQFVWALVGASLVDRVGRRPLLLFANIGCCIVWLCICITSSKFTRHGGTKDSPGTSPAAGTATLAFIFIFGAVFSVGFTPLQALYPVEVLSFEMRAKGMAFQNLVMNVAMLLNQFAWPVSMQKIGWHTYIIFCVWCAVQAVVIYFLIPETKNRTLEELDEIFTAPNPVRASVGTAIAPCA